ncbi:MAG: hypothetical protein Q9188_003532 [Gyalolechia gomerana]
MQEASDKLKILHPNDAKQQVDRVWKRVKLSLKDKFFARLDSQIKGHLAELALQLQILNSHSDISRDARQTQRHQSFEASFRGINNELILQSTSLHNHVAEKAQGLEASLMTLATGVDAADESRVEGSRQLRESLEQIGNTVTNQLNQNEQSSQQHMQLNREQIAAKFDQLRAISANQSQTIVELLHQIHGCLKAQSSAASPVDNTSGTKLQGALDNFTSGDGGRALSAAIDRLSRFASINTTTYDSDEAEDIIDDLECIINALLEHDARSTSATSPNRNLKRHADNRDPDVPNKIKKIRGILTASRAIEIGFSSPHPKLSFHPIIPFDAQIFSAVQLGDVDGMLELFESGKASLNDCDWEGRSLLQYAIYAQQLKPCRFLIGRGADVDSMELNLLTDCYSARLEQHTDNDFEMDRYSLATHLKIRQILLESGADPLVQVYQTDKTYDSFDNLLFQSCTAALATVMKYGKEFIDLDKRDEKGQDSFLRMLRNFIPASESITGRIGNNLSQNIILLLGHGANLRTRNLHGQSCLHVLLLNLSVYARIPQISSPERLCYQMMVDAMSLLIKLGTDIYAVNNAGYSVTEWAHYLRKGEAWESALEKAGWNVEQVHQKDHRNGRKVSDDIFAPERNHPRQCSVLQGPYYNIGHGEMMMRQFDIRDTDFESTDSEPTDSESMRTKTESEEVNDSSLEEEEKGQQVDNNPVPELSHRDTNQDNTIEHLFNSDCDEEMGGVPITNAASQPSQNYDHHNKY